ncbi:MAG: CerR family C-terminal domain-containing protein [Comamonadaceae bacterium]
MSKTSSSSSAAKPLRIDGFEARNRLLDAALTLFAEKGFAKTSTREIAQASQVNIASISYYFGDKAGLYRAVFTDPRCNPNVPPESIADAGISLQQALQRLMWSFLDPLKQGHLMQHCMKLHFREMLEPTGIWQEEIDSNIKPAHAALVGVLCRHLGLVKADNDIHALAFSISGLGVMLHIGCDVVTSIRPQLVASHAALDRYCDRLVAYAMALTEAEAQRRALPAAAPRSNRKPSQK